MGWGGSGKGSAPMQISDPTKVIWVGNIPQGTTYQELLAFAQQVGPAKWAQVLKTSAAVGYGVAAEATSAIAALNGASFNGVTLEADQWTGKKTSGPSGGGKGKSWGGVWKPSFMKRSAGDWCGCGGKGWKGGGKGWNSGRLKVTEPKKTLWVGNVPEGTTFQDVLSLAKSVSDEAKWAKVWKDTAAIGFASEEAATDAIVSLNGATLGSVAIMVDMWTGKDKDKPPS